jgi:hypothetical protein
MAGGLTRVPASGKAVAEGFEPLSRPAGCLVRRNRFVQTRHGPRPYLRYVGIAFGNPHIRRVSAAAAAAARYGPAQQNALQSLAGYVFSP